MIVDINRLPQQAASCSQCRQPAPHNMGAVSWPSFDLSGLLSDPKNWALLALAAWLAYAFFFRRRDRDRRRARREEMVKARERYSADVAKIREKYA